jgi:hypothetical protein
MFLTFFDFECSHKPVQADFGLPQGKSALILAPLTLEALAFRQQTDHGLPATHIVPLSCVFCFPTISESYYLKLYRISLFTVFLLLLALYFPVCLRDVSGCAFQCPIITRINGTQHGRLNQYSRDCSVLWQVTCDPLMAVELFIVVAPVSW